MNLILPNPGQWSHAAGVLLVWDRIFIPRGDGTTKATIWCVVRKRYPTWLGYFHKQPEPPPCAHEPLLMEYVYTIKEDGEEVTKRTQYAAAGVAYVGAAPSTYEVEGAPADVLVHICKLCGAVYSEIKFLPPPREKVWMCPTCGPGIAADEDGCCASCGADGVIMETQ